MTLLARTDKYGFHVDTLMNTTLFVTTLSLTTIVSLGCSSSNDDVTDDDRDRDLISDSTDNCPGIYNPDQSADIGELMQLGDACDDEDADSIVDASDNCPVVVNPDQADNDGDGVGDVCTVCGRAKQIADVLQDTDRRHIKPMAAINDKIYFTGRDEGSVNHLWVYDPQAVDNPVTEIESPMLSDASHMISLDNKLYFSAEDEVSGNELWIYDPDQADAPNLLADINSGTGGSYPDSLTELEGKLYFAATDDVRGRELWVFDPSSPQTGAILVAEINATSNGSQPTDFIAHDGKLYFTAISDPGSRALWLYEPARGARFVSQSLPDSDGPPEGQAVALNGKIYFRRWRPDDNGKLWAYDLINPESGASEQADLPGLFTDDDTDDLIAYNNKLFFTYASRVVSYGMELWKFDPSNTAQGVQLAADIYPGANSGRLNYPENYSLAMVELGGKLYMNARNSESGYELMVYVDGDPDGRVTLAADIVPGPDGSFPVNLTSLNDKLYFSADDGVNGPALWEFDPACTQGRSL